MYNILICDDEKDIVSALKIYLETEGYGIFIAYNGQEALDIIENEEIHLALMDIMMPEMDGIKALKVLRKQSNIPVLLLTAKSEDSDKVLGLNVGADDYITKPFSPTEVLARVRSHLRRYMQFGGGQAPDADKHFTVGGIELDDLAKEVYVDGEKVNLTPTEYDILKFLMQNVGTVFSPKEIYMNVWKNEPYGAEGTVAVHIRHLREKIEINPTEPRYLKVVWAKGYKMEGGKV
ncbi:MAG: response regulator transcription factor [Clostridia bacterium]|nr:response regulator transcription factor [Clostridia bacterium]